MERWIKELRGFAIIEIEAGIVLECGYLDRTWMKLIGGQHLDKVIESAQAHNVEADH